MTPELAASLSVSGSPDLILIRLYDARSNPLTNPTNMAAYLERLGRLALLPVG
jgi:hypothetical protein